MKEYYSSSEDDTPQSFCTKRPIDDEDEEEVEEDLETLSEAIRLEVCTVIILIFFCSSEICLIIVALVACLLSLNKHWFVLNL